MPYRPIADYAIIGDTRTAALISSEGSLDWMCFPRFDSPAMFLKLLDDEHGGSCWMRPEGRFETSRRYVPDTCVLETTFRASGGTMTLTDFMPALHSEDESGKGKDVESRHQVVRIASCTSGEVTFRLDLHPTFGFAQERCKAIRRGEERVLFLGPHIALHAQVPARYSITGDGQLSATLRLKEGEEFAVVLTCSFPDEDAPAVGLKEARHALEATLKYWRKWSKALDYSGDYRDLVQRSAMTLKLLTYEPTGAIIAAPTTSLPEMPGGERNYDYRYTWLRDSSLTLVSLMDLANFGEAHDYFHFIHDSIPDRAEDFQVLYRVDGAEELEETDLPLSGYKGSRPVRIGNAAAHQKQLDIFGELMHCAYLYWLHEDFAKHGQSFRRDFWPRVKDVADYVAEHWHERGHGIWEMRGEPKHFTHAKGMCWVALDRALKLARHHGIRTGLEAWEREREKIRQQIETRGYHDGRKAYVQYFDGDALDAAVLRLPVMGVIDPRSERMRSTIAAIEKDLVRNGVVYRYRQDESDDGMPGDEGAFTTCAFWLAENYVLQDRLKDAEELFRHTVGFANDLGLMSEEIDPATGEQLGNFPQGFTHIGLINAAVRIAAAKGQASDETRRMLRGEAGIEESAA